jgi:transcriptional regulator with XRE-family HTH domain
MKKLKFQPRYVSPEQFRDLRRHSDLTRLQAAGLLSVSVRTIQNWETGGARVPWMAYRMLRIIRGYDLPGKAWEGWTLRGDTLYSPDNRAFPAGSLYQLQNTFAQAKLFRQLYARSGPAQPSRVLPFPDRKRPDEALPDGRRPRTVRAAGRAMPFPADSPASRTGGQR